MRPMRTLKWVPLAFLAGAHGFALFAPYAAVVVVACHVNQIVNRRRQARRLAAIA